MARPSRATSLSVTGARRRRIWSAPCSRCRCRRCVATSLLLPMRPEIWPCVKFCVFYTTAEHHELCSAALQPVGSVVRQHAADRTVRPQWMAGTQLWRLRADLGSTGLQVSAGDPVFLVYHDFLAPFMGYCCPLLSQPVTCRCWMDRHERCEQRRHGRAGSGGQRDDANQPDWHEHRRLPHSLIAHRCF